jgi:hypothetical protein
MTLPKYHSFPPLNPPHEPTASLVDRQDAAWAKMYKITLTKADLAKAADKAAYRKFYTPTPTITQMEDRHERQVFAGEAMKYLHWATCAIGGVVMTVLIASLLFRAIVGVY